MPDISPVLKGRNGHSDITDANEWAELSVMIARGDAPHALAAIIPSGSDGFFRDAYARMLLCRSGTGEDGCESCRGWGDDGHPDMVVAGSLGQPAGVADCLALQSSLHLKPVLASRRLGVICSAESLSLPAANSLLKVTEEPPDGVFLLFLAERDNLIPTIRSRVWTLNFHRPAGSVNEPEFPPSTPLEWAAWLERTKKSSLDELVSLVDLWASSLGGRGEWSKSAALQNVMYLSRHRHMPVSMVQDALYAILWEGMHGGQIFGDLREA